MDRDGNLTVTESEITEQQIKAGDITLNVAFAGDPNAKPLLLVHGLYDRWERWQPVIDPLSQQFRLIMPDLRGHARSDKPPRDYLPVHYARDLLNLLTALELETTAVIGHSLGGIIGIYLASDTSELVSELVVVDPPLDWSTEQREMTSILLDAKRGTVEETRQLFDELYWHLDDDERARMVAWLRDTADGPFEAMLDMIDQRRGSEIFDRLERVTCPIMLMQADPMAGSAVSNQSVAYAKTVNHSIEHIVIEDAGHAIHHHQPEKFVEVVAGFVAAN